MSAMLRGWLCIILFSTLSGGCNREYAARKPPGFRHLLRGGFTETTGDGRCGLPGRMREWRFIFNSAAAAPS
jgi:hypothetical protein